MVEKKFIVTGAAGFIGSNLVDDLLSRGFEVCGVDNFATGREEFLADAFKSTKFRFEKLDMQDATKVSKLFTTYKPQTVVHLAANADVRFGLEHPRKDLELGTILTFNVLEAARNSGASKFAFSSTGSVYGEPKIFPTPEDAPFPVQTSLYAASKLAAEGLIQAYAEGYGIQGYIFRFVSILGERYTHGHVFDFAKKILSNPNQIQVLGNGKQSKAYLYVKDCTRAIMHILETQEEKVNIFNLGPDEYITVDQSLDEICKSMGVGPQRVYTGTERGWIGDSPFIFLDCTRLKNTGWKASLSIRSSVTKTLEYLLANKWLLS